MNRHRRLARCFGGGTTFPMVRFLGVVVVVGFGLSMAGCTRISELSGSIDESYKTLMQDAGTPEPDPSAVSPGSSASPTSASTGDKGAAETVGRFEIINRGTSIEQSYSQISDRIVPAGARFIDAEVNEFLRIVFEEILVVPFVTVGRIEGSVNLELGPDLPLSTWINAIDNQVEPFGGSLRFERGVFAVVKEGEGLFASSRNVGFLPLTYTAPSDAAEILASVFPDVQVIPAEAAGALVILEFQRLALFLEIADFARTLDRGSLQGKTLFVHRLTKAPAADVVRELELITSPSDQGIGNLYRFARFLPIERMNAVLGVVPHGADVRLLRSLIEGLDKVDTPRLAQGFRLVPLNNSRASDVVVQIRSLVGDGPPPLVDPAVAPKPRTALSSRPGYFQRQRAGKARRETSAMAFEGNDGANYGDDELPLEYDLAYEPESGSGYRREYDAASQQLRTGGVGYADGGQVFRITADTARNAILISGEPALLNSIEALIKDIDREEVRQVYIETALVDIDLREQLQYGLSSIISAGDAELIPFSTGAAIEPTFAGLNLLFDNNTIAGVLNLLSSVSDVRVVSAPRLAMVNNSQAVLNVGDEVPVLTSQVTDTSNPDAVVNSVEFRETGVILRLAPTIMSDKAVLLDITQELTEARGTSEEAVQLTPLFSRRSLQTSLRIYSGDVIMLGGLKARSASVTKDRVPIPILSDIFGSTGDAAEVREMVLLVRPLIVRDRQQLLRITNEVRERLDAIWGIESIRKNVFDNDTKL